MFPQEFSGKAFFFAQQSEQQMLGANVFVVQALGFFCRIGQDPLAFIAERQVHRGGNFVPARRVMFHLPADGFHRSV